MTRHDRLFHGVRSLAAAGGALVATLACAAPCAAQDCLSILGLLQQGRSATEIARMTGMTATDVQVCRRELSEPIFVGPEGVPPRGAAGPPPRDAAGPPPGGSAAGAPPVGAAGPPPVGRELRRLP